MLQNRVHNPGKAVGVSIIYFLATVVLAMGPQIKDGMKWSEVLGPSVILPGLGAGLIAVAGLWDQTIRHKRKDDDA